MVQLQTPYILERQYATELQASASVANHDSLHLQVNILRTVSRKPAAVVVGRDPPCYHLLGISLLSYHEWSRQLFLSFGLPQSATYLCDLFLVSSVPWHRVACIILYCNCGCFCTACYTFQISQNDRVEHEICEQLIECVVYWCSSILTAHQRLHSLQNEQNKYYGYKNCLLLHHIVMSSCFIGRRISLPSSWYLVVKGVPVRKK